MGQMKQLAIIKQYIEELGGDGSVVDYLLMAPFEKAVYDLEKEVTALANKLKIMFGNYPHISNYKMEDLCVYEISISKYHFQLDVTLEKDHPFDEEKTLIKKYYEIKEWEEIYEESPILIGSGKSSVSFDKCLKDYRTNRTKRLNEIEKRIMFAKNQFIKCAKKNLNELQ